LDSSISEENNFPEMDSGIDFERHRSITISTDHRDTDGCNQMEDQVNDCDEIKIARVFLEMH
jgi:hypothetical protein